MKKMLIMAFILLILFSGMFIAFDYYGYAEPEYSLHSLKELTANGWGKEAVFGVIVILLAIDLLLPVPSSIVMVFSGYFLGIFWGGIASFTGAMMAAIIGFGACRFLGSRAFEKFVGKDEISGVEQWFERYGVIAIIISRPVPMLTEILSCLAGISQIPFYTFLAASISGTLPICFIYSFAGSCGKENAPLITILIAVIVPAIGWIVTRYIKRSPS